MALGMVVGLGPVDIVLDGDTAPLPKRGGRAPPPKKSAHFYCGQTAGCIKMPLGTEVGLGPAGRHCVRYGALFLKKAVEPHSPIFGPCPLRSNGWMDQDGT